MPRVRLVGVRVQHLSSSRDAPMQVELSERPGTWTDLEVAMDRALERFGGGSLTRGGSALGIDRGRPGRGGEDEDQGPDR